MGNRLRETFSENSCYKIFFLSLLITGLSFGIYKGLQDNYLAEVVSMGELDRGITEFFRELPGLLLIFILIVFYTFSAETMYKIGATVTLLGVAMLAIVPPVKVLVIVSMFVHSLGDHIQLGMKNTLTLNYARPGKGGVALGYQNSIHQVGTLAGYLVVVLAFAVLGGKMPFKLFFALSGAVMLWGVIVSLRITGNSETDDTKRRFYFKKKFTKYYMLEVFYGARKQVFFTFGPYVLILMYGASAMVISLLFAVSAVCTYFFAPLVGKIIDRFGYKIVMIMDTLILVIVCFFYGFSHHIFPEKIAFIVCCVNYVLDSIISLASMASNVYVQDISDSPDEMKATISTGVSVNHMITVLIALFGGWIWHAVGVETLFIMSAVLGLANSAYAATVNPEKDRLR
ncbi:MAG: MFS transporter [Firmicutes bacterium]|jgi:Arabinose efflux permease|nr:MFS transporter [Clostridiales bacterium]MBQ5954932.1 MFS transporter [Bacillota bacterium]MBQ6089024.1 MFS transporter [Bacillota bacterium]MBQ6607533.1 MFS transporter [Bacillota bacterium]MBR3375899.1 MFS transporter [Bacillota bacterium]